VSKVGALVAVLALWCSAAYGARLTEAEYAAAVARAAGSLERAAGLGNDGRAVARQALDDLPLKVEVAGAPGERVLTVDNRGLAKSLRKQVGQGPRGMRAAAGALRNLQSGLVEQKRAGQGQARALLAEVLSRREFQASWADKLRQRVYAWLFRLLEAILGHFPEVNLPKNLVTWVLWSLVAVASLAAIALVVRLVIRYEPPKVKTEVVAEEVAIRSHQEWLAEAEVRRAVGDYRAALRAMHMAALLKLDEAGLVRFDQCATDGKFLRLLKSKGLHELAAALGALNQLFSVVWYGSAPAGPQEYVTAQARWAELEALTAT
jgi:hypothetical protein